MFTLFFNLPYYVINILLTFQWNFTRNNLTDTDKLFFEKKGTKNPASMGNLRGVDKTVRQNKLIFLQFNQKRLDKIVYLCYNYNRQKYLPNYIITYS